MPSWQRKAQRPTPPLGLPLWYGQKTWRRKNPERARCEGEGTGKLWVTQGNVKGKPCSFLLATSHLFLCIWGRDMLGIPDTILMKGPSWFPQKQQEPSTWSPNSPHSHIPEQQPDVFLGPRQPTRMTTSHSGGGFPNPLGPPLSPASAHPPPQVLLLALVISEKSFLCCLLHQRTLHLSARKIS